MYNTQSKVASYGRIGSLKFSLWHGQYAETLAKLWTEVLTGSISFPSSSTATYPFHLPESDSASIKGLAAMLWTYPVLRFLIVVFTLTCFCAASAESRTLLNGEFKCEGRTSRSFTLRGTRALLRVPFPSW